MIACYFVIHSRTIEIWREGFFCWKFWNFAFIVGLWARGKQPRLDFGTLDLPFLDHSISELGIYYKQKYDNTDNNIPHKKALYHISQNNKQAATHTHNIKSLNTLLSNQLSTRFIRMWIQKEIWYVGHGTCAEEKRNPSPLHLHHQNTVTSSPDHTKKRRPHSQRFYVLTNFNNKKLGTIARIIWDLTLHGKYMLLRDWKGNEQEKLL